MKQTYFIYLFTFCFLISCSSKEENEEEKKTEESTEESVAPEEEASEMNAPAEEEIPIEEENAPIEAEETAEPTEKNAKTTNPNDPNLPSEGSGINKGDGNSSGVKPKGTLNAKSEITVGEEGVR